jgi:purine-binding chemotaxis protein CheW
VSVGRRADISESPQHQIASEDTASQTIGRVVGFVLAGQRYALPIERVREIQQIVALSEVPGQANGVIGMVNLRGHVIPAVDMRRLVGLEAREYTLQTPMVISEIHGQLIALLVDEVLDVFELPADSLQEAPALHQLSGSMLGVARLGDGLVYVLDPDRLVGAHLFERG